MLSSILLDALLVIILLMMIPLGFLRGGLREVCTAAGIMFGILVSNAWSSSWGSWLADRLDVEVEAAQFVVGVAIVVLSGAMLGYGGSAAFSYHPGPGGRMYGACIALFSGVLFAGYLINMVVERVYDSTAPDVIADAYVARALSSGFGWVLLVCAVGVVAATLFGMLVRERPDESSPYAYVPEPVAQSVRQPSPPPEASTRPNEPGPSAQAPVRIREVRHWEDTRPEGQGQGYGSGWRQTWPEPKGQGPIPPWEQRPAPPAPSPKRVTGSTRRREEPPSSSRDVLRDWMEEEGSGENQ